MPNRRKRREKKTINKIIILIISLFLGIFFILWGKVHIFLATMIPHLHFCSYFACIIFSLIWFAFAGIAIYFLIKKKKKRMGRIWYIPMGVILFIGLILMNITSCDTDGIHFGFGAGGYLAQSIVSTTDTCTSGVDCPGDIVEVPIPPCIETDDGQDYITPGMILSGADIEDVCMSSDLLRERYCNSRLTYTSEDVSCSDLFGADWICEDRECILDTTPVVTPPDDDDDDDDDGVGNETDCGDGVDNDDDGNIDCADSDCNFAFEDGGCGDFESSCQHNPTHDYPFCGGTCPIGEECIVYYTGDGTMDGNWCECAPIGVTPCGVSGDCTGWCLEDDTCLSDTHGCYCTLNFCSDSDYENSPGEFGTCTDETGSYEDECVEGILHEYRCWEEAKTYDIEMSCDYLEYDCNEWIIGYECVAGYCAPP